MTLRYYTTNIEYDYLLATTHRIKTTANRSARAPIINPMTAPMEISLSDSLTSGIVVGDSITNVVVDATEMVVVEVGNIRDGISVRTTTRM